MAKQKKSLFDIVVVPSLAAFFLGLVAIGLSLISNWVGDKKDHDATKKASDHTASLPSPADKVAQSNDGKKHAPPEPKPIPQPDVSKIKPIPAFQPHSTPTTSIAVGDGKVEVTARAIEENRIIISIVARDFSMDPKGLVPLQEWLKNTLKNRAADLFHRKLKELGVGAGQWLLVSQPMAIQLAGGYGTLELTWERK